MTETPFIPPPLLTDVPSLAPTETETASVTPTETETPTLTLTPLEQATELVLPPVDVPSSPPDTPVGAAPLGTTTALRPEFTWAQISGADQYYLWVADTEGQVWDAWYAEDIICQTGTCRVTLSFDLYANDFRWWLQAWSSAGGYSSWSGQHDFRVAVPPRPPVEFRVGHTGEVVTYEWRPVRGVSWYYLWVSSSSTGYVLDQWYNANNICTSGWCTVLPVNDATPVPTPIAHQANAIHSWWVQGYNNAGGYGVWSSEQQFVYSSAPDWSHTCSFVGSPRGWSVNSYSGVSMGYHDSGGFTSNTSGTDNLDIRSPAMSGTFEIETAQFYFNGSWIGQNQRIIVYQTGNSAVRYGTSVASSPGAGDPINLLMSQAVNVSTISVNLDRNVDGNAQYFGTLRLTGITLSGAGTNPFGVENCALIATPTSTPTTTATPTYEGCGLPLGGDPESTEEPICYVYTPQPTPTASPTATATSEPFQIWYVACDVSGGYLRARNYPTLDGEVIANIPAGTVLYGFEQRSDEDGRQWLRITGYEAATHDTTLWSAIASDGITNLTQIEPTLQSTPCAFSTPVALSSITPYPTTTATALPVILAPSPCPNGRTCPLSGTQPSDLDIVSFVLACEGGVAVPIANSARISDALAIAHVIYNRMTSATFHSSAADVVRQGSGSVGQFQCYAEGAPSSLGLNNLSALSVLPVEIRAAAQSLVNGQEPADLPPATMDGRVDYYGLYTFGVYGDVTQAAMTPPPVAELLDPYCTNLPLTLQLFVAIAPFGSGSVNTTAYFSDFHNCALQ